MLGKKEVVKSTSECYGRLDDFMLESEGYIDKELRTHIFYIL